MTEYAKTLPEHNPADVDSLEGLLNFLGDKISMGIDCCIPGVITAYDVATRRATIKPQITGVASLGQKISKEAYTNIPVYMPGCSTFEIIYPVSVGASGWLIACDRNISIFKQNKEESAPNDYRKHCFEDGFFLIDSINGIGSTDLVLKTVSEILTISDITGITATNFKALNGATGTFKSADSPQKTITVVNGIITSIA